MTKIFSAIAILSLSAILFVPSACKKNDKATETPIPEVSVAYPEIDSVMLRKSYPGFLTANNEVELVARVNGTLIAHPYQPGQKVKKGDILFRIDDSTYRNSLQQAQAELAQAQASYDYYSKEYEKMLKALELDAVSEMEVSQTKSNMDQAAAQISSYKAAVETAQTTLGYCTVRAPFDGRVSQWNFDTGSYVAGEGQATVLATIYDDSTVYANIQIDDDSYLDLVNNAKEGLDLSQMPVTFSEELPHSYTASLNYLAPEIDKTTGTMLVRAVIDNPYGELKSGMYAVIGLPYEALQKAVLIEDAAIGTDQLGKYIYVVNDSDKIVYTPIEAGDVVNGTKRVVIKGITPDERYITKAMLKVRDGETVKPVMTAK